MRLYFARIAHAVGLFLPLQLPAQEVGIRLGPVLVDTESDTVIGSATQLSRLAKSGIVVADLRARAFHLVDRKGAVVWRAGRGGEGPGEFRNISYAWIRNGMLYVVDRALRRTTRFAMDGGRVLDTEVMPPLSDGVQRMGTLPNPITEAGGCRLWMVRSHADVKPQVSQIFAETPKGISPVLWANPLDAGVVTFNAGGQDRAFFLPYVPVPLPGFDYVNGDMVIPSRPSVRAVEVKVSLSRYNSCGQLLGKPREVVLKAIPFPPGERARIEKSWQEGAARIGVPASRVSTALAEHLYFPPAHPPLITLMVSSDGRPFGRRSGEGLEPVSSMLRHWIVFPQGSESPVEFVTRRTMTVIDVVGKEVLLLDLPNGPGGKEQLRIGALP